MHAQGYPKKSLDHGVENEISAQVRQWRESNHALARLLEIHRPFLQSAVASAERIGRDLDRLTPHMLALCRRTCRFCPDPCCILNTVWFDFRDLLFLHLLRVPVPPCQAASDSHDACPYLAGRGCRLPRRSRPFMCIRYLCPSQRSILQKELESSKSAVLAQIDAIDHQRQQMESEVVRCIRRRRRMVNTTAIVDHWETESQGHIGHSIHP